MTLELTEQNALKKDALITRLLSFTSSNAVEYMKRLWETPDCRREKGIIYAMFSFDRFETDTIMINLPENEFWNNVVSLLGKRNSEWINKLVDDSHDSDNKSKNHILDALKTMSSK